MDAVAIALSDHVTFTSDRAVACALWTMKINSHHSRKICSFIFLTYNGQTVNRILVPTFEVVFCVAWILGTFMVLFDRGIKTTLVYENSTK